jgi:hypothetical protein
MIEKLPDQDEVHKILKEIANNKAPGIDGIIAEVLKECWSFVGNDFYASGTPENYTLNFWKELFA